MNRTIWRQYTIFNSLNWRMISIHPLPGNSNSVHKHTRNWWYGCQVQRWVKSDKYRIGNVKRDNRKKGRKKYIGIKRVVGVVSFGGFSSVLEEKEAIKIILRKLHGWGMDKWKRKRDSGENLGSQITAPCRQTESFSLIYSATAIGATTQPVGFRATELCFGPNFVWTGPFP